MIDLTEPSPDELRDIPLDELRSRRDELEREETAVSYTRRLVQGRLDIVSAELRRRDEGAAPSQLTEIIAELPSSLAGGVQGGGGLPRPVLEVPPTDRVGELVAQFDVVLPPERFAGLASVTDDELRDIARSLLEAEQQVSQLRRRLHVVIDAVHGEIIRRYQTGEATVDSLLG